MPYAELDGTRLFFTDEGEGPPILFVHGYTCDSHDWSWHLLAGVTALPSLVAPAPGRRRPSARAATDHARHGRRDRTHLVALVRRGLPPPPEVPSAVDLHRPGAGYVRARRVRRRSIDVA